MENQQKSVYLSTNDVKDLLNYLKDYSVITGKFYNHANDIVTKQQIATLNFDLNKMIKKLEKELERN